MEFAEMFTEYVGIAVQRVFSTMAAMETVLGTVNDLTPHHSEPLQPVTGSVSFTGKMTGIIYISIQESLIQAVTNHILGSGMTEKEENDVLGELTNMVTGNVKTAMADKGYNAQLSIPTVLRGDSITFSCRGFSIAKGLSFQVPSLKTEIQIRAMVRPEV